MVCCMQDQRTTALVGSQCYLQKRVVTALDPAWAQLRTTSRDVTFGIDIDGQHIAGGDTSIYVVGASSVECMM